MIYTISMRMLDGVRNLSKLQVKNTHTNYAPELSNAVRVSVGPHFVRQQTQKAYLYKLLR